MGLVTPLNVTSAEPSCIKPTEKFGIVIDPRDIDIAVELLFIKIV